MGMNVNAVIHCLKDAKAIDCLDCPYFAERKGSITSCRMKRLDEAKEIIEKYQKIEELIEYHMLRFLPKERMNGFQKDILEVIEDGNDNR